MTARTIQAYRFEDTFLPEKGATSVRGRGLNGQGGGVLEARFYPIATGVDGLNFRLSHDRVPDGFFSPRHRHNFDQFRFVLSGSINIGKNLELHEGECGYFPEGTYYGPQDQTGEGVQLVMQFPGPRGSHFMDRDEFKAATDKLRASGGVFENGVFKGRRADGKPFNQDGFEAVWQAANGRPVSYSEERYSEPVIMTPSHFGWVQDERRSGVQVKHLGTFNEYRTSVAQWRLSPGTVIPSEVLAAPQVRFVIDGDLIYAGKELSSRGCLYIPDGLPAAPLESRSGVQLLVISVPMYVPEVWQRAHQTSLQMSGSPIR